MTAGSANPAAVARGGTVTPPHFFADLYSFDWSQFRLRLPLVSAGGVAMCLFAGVLAGHPGAGLVAGGGAFTVGFGPHQRICDSRLIPMMAAVLGVAAATLLGTVAGHHGWGLLIAAGAFAFLYGDLTARHTGVAWVAQQSSIALLVASAFPTGLRPALMRAALLAAGGVVQVLVTTTGLSLLRDLRRDALAIPVHLYRTAAERERELVRRLRRLPKSLPALSRLHALHYAIRLGMTVLIATEIYRRIGVQSGYWIPMTALLVQKPAFFETISRAGARVGGTLAGAVLCSLLLLHTSPRPELLALITALFALGAYATLPINYGLYTACITGYIVFLLSLNEIPGPVVAERRAWCTALGALIAVAIHLDALRRHRGGSRRPRTRRTGTLQGQA